MNIKKSAKVMNARRDVAMKDLAEYLKITGVYLSRMLGDNNPKYIMDMASFYGVTVSDFVKEGER